MLAAVRQGAHQDPGMCARPETGNYFAALNRFSISAQLATFHQAAR